MNLKNLKWNKIYLTIFALLVTAFYMHLARGQFVYEGDRALYMDDMAAHQIYTDSSLSLFQKITFLGANKIRYVTNIILILFWKIIGRNYERADIVMMLSNIAMACAVWFSIYLSLGSNTDWKKRFLYTWGGYYYSPRRGSLTTVTKRISVLWRMHARFYRCFSSPFCGRTIFHFPASSAFPT